MSVVVWDGKSLAADMQATNCGMRSKVSKAVRIASGEVLAFTGDYEQGLVLAEWYENGADRDKYPAFQKMADWTRLIVGDASGVKIYEREPIPQRFDEPFMAFGSGRDFAMGALAMGADARTAVEVAGRFNVDCGCGVEVFELI